MRMCPEIGDSNAGALSVSVKVKRDHEMEIWVCLKMGYTPNYSHLVVIMIINHWV